MSPIKKRGNHYPAFFVPVFMSNLADISGDTYQAGQAAGTISLVSAVSTR